MCIEMQTRLFVLVAVGKESSDQMNHKIDGTAMTRMLNLRDILELVDNGLNDCPFAYQQLIGKVHQMVLHVFAQPGHQMQPLFKEQLRQGKGNVATIPKQLAAQPFHQSWNRRAIIDVAWRQTTSQQFASIIDGQVQFKPKEPSHARLAAPGIGGKDAMLTDPLGITDCQGRRINEADAGAGSKAALEIGEHRNHHGGNERDKAWITHQMRKFLRQMHLNMFGVVRLEGSIVRLMKMNQNRHHLTWTELARTLSLFASLHLGGFPVWLKAYHEVIDITKQFE